MTTTATRYQRRSPEPVQQRPAYRPQQKPVHPVDRIRQEMSNLQDPKHPAREAIEASLGHHTLTAVVEEDLQTLAAMKHVEGLVAFLCTLVKDGKVISQGRGSVVLGPNNRFIQRAIGSAFNSALADAAIRATKVLDTFRGKPVGEGEGYEEEKATDKQREYLRQLIHTNIEDEEERERWESQLSELTKSEASKAIENFKR